ncbi:hypothetical protein [Sphingobium sp. D43FB]|uniref:hypothetical protein n=1 Tax=Sphingobium sp. D43FB TaxID=2017595 RepID=UPI000BB5509F|nr:hypothetical protein [Sphingobium sp. D43FB]PBN41384.1 hypothetical protein SxD43FB_22060 [Sphingobium sp. D43FB]
MFDWQRFGYNISIHIVPDEDASLAGFDHPRPVCFPDQNCAGGYCDDQPRIRPANGDRGWIADFGLRTEMP